MIKASKFCIDGEDNLLGNKSAVRSNLHFEDDLANDEILEPKVTKKLKLGLERSSTIGDQLADLKVELSFDKNTSEHNSLIKEEVDSKNSDKHGSFFVNNFDLNLNSNYQDNLSNCGLGLEIMKSIDQENDDVLKIFEMESSKKDTIIVANDTCTDKKESVNIHSDWTNNFNNSIDGESDIINNILAPLREEAEAIDNIYNNKVEDISPRNCGESLQLNIDSLFNDDKATVKSEEITCPWYHIFGNNFSLDELKNIHEILFEYYKLVK